MLPMQIEAIECFQSAVKEGYKHCKSGWGYGYIRKYMKEHNFTLSRLDYVTLINLYDHEGQMERNRNSKYSSNNIPKWKKSFNQMMKNPAQSNKRSLEELETAYILNSGLNSTCNDAELSPPPSSSSSSLEQQQQHPSKKKRIDCTKNLLVGGGDEIVWNKEYRCPCIHRIDVPFNRTSIHDQIVSSIKLGLIHKNQAFCVGILPKFRSIGFVMEDGGIFDPIHWGFQQEEENRRFGTTEEDRKGPVLFANFDYWRRIIRTKPDHTFTTSNIIRMLYRKKGTWQKIYAISLNDLNVLTKEQLEKQLDQLDLIPYVLLPHYNYESIDRSSLMCSYFLIPKLYKEE